MGHACWGGMKTVFSSTEPAEKRNALVFRPMEKADSFDLRENRTCLSCVRWQELTCCQDNKGSSEALLRPCSTQRLRWGPRWAEALLGPWSPTPVVPVWGLRWAQILL